MRWGAAAILALIACGGGAPERVRDPEPALPADAAPADAAPAAAVPVPDAGPTLTEAQARALMARRFRAAGFRIRQDVRVGGATLDGADPERQVGYEYVAEREDARPPAVEGWHILVVEATNLAQLTARVDAFVSALPDPRSE